MKCLSVPLFLAVAGLLAAPALADNAPPLGALGRMPITEVTVFKDGHALVLHAGKMPTDGAGNVLLDYLPSPVMGTFWPASANANAKLSAVTASQRRVMVERTALSVRELIEANVGAEVMIKEVAEAANQGGAEYGATIIGMPQRSVDELEAVSPPNTAPKLPEKGNVVLLKTANGVKVLDIGRIQNVTFKNNPKPALGNEELRNMLTLKLEWPQQKAEAQTDVTLMYVQKGIRWIPEYKVTIDGKGQAAVVLQATLINELYDLKDVTANLVVGVPTFQFADTADPIGLQQAIAQLSPYFQRNAQTASQFSNSIMSQAGGFGGRGGGNGPAAETPVDLGPEVGGSTKNEDLFIFTVNHITLKKGDRMVVPIKDFKIPYKDVFVLDLPFTPPPEVWRSFNANQQSDLARQVVTPKVMHVLRFNNTSEFPITTAPALVVSNGKVLAQGLSTYTPKGGVMDLTLTTAVDIAVKKSDKEVKRSPNAVNWEGNAYGRVDLEGTITLTNRRATAVDLEITRNLLGEADKADNDGKLEMLNLFEDRSFLPAGQDGAQPYWWGWYSWPYWWSHFNGIGAISWKKTLDPGKDLTLTYSWHYYWR